MLANQAVACFWASAGPCRRWVNSKWGANPPKQKTSVVILGGKLLLRNGTPGNQAKKNSKRRIPPEILCEAKKRGKRIGPLSKKKRDGAWGAGGGTTKRSGPAQQQRKKWEGRLRGWVVARRTYATGTKRFALCAGFGRKIEEKESGGEGLLKPVSGRSGTT